MKVDSKRPQSARKPAAIVRSKRKAEMGLPPEFPLFPHKSGRWAKQVHGKRRYFGPIEGDEKGKAALNRWLEQKDDLLAGREPRQDGDGLTLGTLCNKFLGTKHVQMKLGKLAARSFMEYTRCTDTLVDTWGKNRRVDDLRPDDFEKLYHKLARKFGLTTLGREVTMVRSVFKYAVEADLIDRAVRFGPLFKSPSKADKRKARAKAKHANGAKMFSAADITAMLNKAGPQLKAMILLGINAGLGNTDCSTLPLSAVDLDAGWLDFPRPKTGIDRRIPLWAETIAALRVVIEGKRPTAKRPEHQKLVFITRTGRPWTRYELDEADDGAVKATSDDAIAKATRKLLDDLGIYRPGLSFYALRHGFETIGGGSGDQVAVDAIMGHVDGSMGAEYREHIDDARLVAVVEHVRRWLYPPEQEQAPAEKPAALRIVG